MPKSTARNRFVIAGAVLALLGFSTVARAQVADPPGPIDETPGLDLRAPASGEEKGDAAEADSPNARLEWERTAYGVVTSAFRANELKEAKNHNAKKNAPGPRWVSIGPAGGDFDQNGASTGNETDSGRIRTILTHPTDANIVYALTSGGGLWRTNNWMSNDTTWKPLTDDLPTTGGGSVAFGVDPNTLYLGLGDPYDQILAGGAMSKSNNGGVSWSDPVELGNAVSVRDVKVDTSTGTDIVLAATDAGLFRSADGGLTYSAVPAFGTMSVWSIVRSSAGWLVSAQPCPVSAVGLRCGQATQLFFSSDAGATWSLITNAGNVFSNNGRTTLAVATAGDPVVYAYSSTVNDSALKDVYRSADGGQTWTPKGVNASKAPVNPVSGQTNLNICDGQCWYDQLLLVDPTDPTRNTVWMGGNLATARSTDGGTSWALKTWWLYHQVPSLPYAHADFHAATYKTTGTPTIILGDDGGLNVSTDNGITFSSAKNRGLVSHLFYTVTGTGQRPNAVLGGLQDNGTRLRTDNDSGFNQVIGGDGMGAAFSVDNTNTVIGSSQSSGLRTNLSNAFPLVFQNWTAARTGLADGAGAGFFTSIVPAPRTLDSSGRVFFHFTNSRVWRSNNGALTWTRIGSASFPTSAGLPPNRRFRSNAYNLAVSPNDLNRIALGAAGGFLDITSDGGATWTDINLVAKVPGYQGFVSSVTWQNNRTLWITAAAQATGAVRLIRATIANDSDPWTTATFTVLQSGLPDLPVNRIAVDPKDSTGRTLYAASHVGVYATTDGGVSWKPFGNGLPTVRVNDIYMSPDGSTMRIATYGRGIWQMSQVEVVNTTLVDDGTSCDNDGILDNGETGSLRFTLKNQGPNNVNQVKVTFSSSNPHLTFPKGNIASFPPLQKNGESKGSIAVALNGAMGTESSDISVSVTAPELGASSALNLVSSQRLNYDELATSTDTDTVEPSATDWTVGGGTPTGANILSWQRRALSDLSHVWWGPDNNGQTDGVRPDGPDQQTLTSPTLHVGAGPLSVSFSHRFSFENGRWDGGVVELSTDGGSTWSDIGAPAYNGSTVADTSAPIGANRPAFVNRMIGWPNFAPVTLNLGTTYANSDVKIRFRVGADESTGAPGWDIDNIAVTGAGTPFRGTVPNAGVCTTKK